MHRLNWDEGYDGKGLVDQKGNVHTWNDGVDYWFHNNYERENKVKGKVFFYITPEGIVHDGGMPSIKGESRDPKQFANQIQTADPRLEVPGDQTWEF